MKTYTQRVGPAFCYTKHTRAARWCNSSQLPMVLCWKDEWSGTCRGRQWRHAHTHLYFICILIVWSDSYTTQSTGGKKKKEDALTDGSSNSVCAAHQKRSFCFPLNLSFDNVGLTMDKGRWRDTRRAAMKESRRKVGGVQCGLASSGVSCT